MSYSNPNIPEKINYSDENPLKEFFILVLGVSFSIVIFILIISFFAEKFAHYIPYKYEEKIANGYLAQHEKYSDTHQQFVITEKHVQTIANKLAHYQNISDDIKITVHIADSDTVNAYATLGGHIIINSGLLKKLPHENALTFVLAHEVAHIKYRHPISSLSRGIILSLGIGLISGATDNTSLGHFLGEAGLFTALSFSREQEREADKEALFSLKKYYGHVQGAIDLFVIFQKEETQKYIPEIMNTHPLTENRIALISKDQKLQKNQKNTTTPLPAKVIEDIKNSNVEN